MPAPRIAVVTHNIHVRGGTRSMTGFVVDVLDRSGRFDHDVITLATSVRDDCSVRLAAPSTWLRGVRVDRREQQGLPTIHVGCRFAELEPRRYAPRDVLDRLLEPYDALFVVAGAPPWGHAVSRVRKPQVLWAATSFLTDRRTRLEDERGARRLVLTVMTRVCRGLEPRALARADRVLALSDYTMRLFAPHVAPERLSLCFAGVDAARFRPAPHRPAGPILAVGRLSDPRKNVTLLFRAYAGVVSMLGERAPRLLLVGGAPSPEQMAAASDLGIAGRVEVRENVGADDLAEAYREASMFALSSDEEGLGIVILEAMATARPVVATRCGGPESVVEDGRTGLLVPVGDGDALAAAMSALVDDPGKAAAMGSAARAAVEARFSREAAGRVVTDALDSVLAGGRGPGPVPY